MQAQKGVGIILDYGNCKFKYGEFEFGSEQFEKKISQRGEGEGSTIGGIK